MIHAADWHDELRGNLSHSLLGISHLRYDASQANPDSSPMPANTTMVHVRLDEQLKAQATETLANMGLTVSDAIRVFLTRVVADQALPFALKAPNPSSHAAIAEAEEIIASRRARFTDPNALLNELQEASRE